MAALWFSVLYVLREILDVHLNCVPVHIRSSLLHHGLLPVQDLHGVEDVEEVDRHVERHRDVLPHGVGHLVLWVNHGVLTRKGKETRKNYELLIII